MENTIAVQDPYESRRYKDEGWYESQSYRWIHTLTLGKYDYVFPDLTVPRNTELWSSMVKAQRMFHDAWGRWPWYLKKPQDPMAHEGKLCFIKRPGDRFRWNPTTGDTLEPKFTITTPGKIMEAMGISAMCGDAAVGLVAEAYEKALAAPDTSHLSHYILNDSEDIWENYADETFADYFVPGEDYDDNDDDDSAISNFHTCMEGSPGPRAYGKPGNLALLVIKDKNWSGPFVARCIIMREDRKPIDETKIQEGQKYLSARLYMLGTKSSEYADGSGLEKKARNAIELYVKNLGVTVDPSKMTGAVLRKHWYGEQSRDLCVPYVDSTEMAYFDFQEDSDKIFLKRHGQYEARNTSGVVYIERACVCSYCNNTVRSNAFNSDMEMCQDCLDAYFFYCRACSSYHNLEDNEIKESAEGYLYCKTCWDELVKDEELVIPCDDTLYHRRNNLSLGTSGRLYSRDYDVCITQNGTFIPDQGELIVRAKYSKYEATCAHAKLDTFYGNRYMYVGNGIFLDGRFELPITLLKSYIEFCAFVQMPVPSWLSSMIDAYSARQVPTQKQEAEHEAAISI